MAKARATFGKRERDRAKRERADMKREKRAEKSAEPDASEEAPVDTSGNDRILEAVAALHERYDNEEIDIDTFEEQRAELMSRLAIE